MQREQHVLADVRDEGRIRTERGFQIRKRPLGRDLRRVVGSEPGGVERRALLQRAHDR